MKTIRDERRRVERISALVDQLIDDPDARPGGLALDDAGLLDTARRLARLPALLGPVDPALEQRVMRLVAEAPESRPRRARGRKSRRRLNLGWAVAGLAAVLLLAALLTPVGQTALAGFLAVFDLGQTQVRITPVDTPSAPLETVVAQSTAVQHRLTLDEAQALVSFAIPQPGYLPAGFELTAVHTYHYPDLPAWVPQPLFVELVYGDAQGRSCSLRVYPIMLGEETSISGLNLEAAPIRDVRDVDVGGKPGVFMHLGTDEGDVALREVVWEQDDLILALSAPALSEDELLRVARSVRPTPTLSPAGEGD